MRLVRVLLLAVVASTAAAAALSVLAGSGGAELGTLWHAVAPESLNLTQAVTQRYVHPAVWTRGILPVLLMPAAAVFTATAVAALLLFLATFLLKRGKTK